MTTPYLHNYVYITTINMEKQNMLKSINEQLDASLQKYILLKQGAVKLLNTPSITRGARTQAQQELHDAQEQIFQLEKQIGLLDRIYNADSKLDNSQQTLAGSVYNSPTKTLNSETSNNFALQATLDTMIEDLKNSDFPIEKVTLTNQICDFLNNTNGVTKFKLPSMIVLIPIIWPMLMSEHRSVNACGYKLLRYFMTSYDDVAMVFYLYLKYHHHERYFFYPYNKYEKNHDSRFLSSAESDLLDLYNFSDPYKIENNDSSDFGSNTEDNNNYNNNNSSSSSITSKLNSKLLEQISIKPINTKLKMTNVTDSTIERWWPLLFIITNTLIEEKGVDVVECIKFIRKVIELKGIKFIDSLGVRTLVILVESLIASVSLKLNNFQSVSTSMLESIALGISSMECLCEITIADSQLAYECGVIKYLAQILIDPPFLATTDMQYNGYPNNAIKNLSVMPLPIILSLLKVPKTREYFIDLNFIPLLLSSLLDPQASALGNTFKARINSPKLQHLSSILSVIICTWSGLGLFLENDAKNLRTLINGLYAEQVYIRTIVMSIIASCLRIRKLATLTGNNESYELLDWEMAFINLNNLNIQLIDDSKNGDIFESLSNLNDFSLSEIKSKMGGRCCPEFEDNVVNQFTAIFLQACLQCGLIDILKKLSNTFKDDKRATRWIALLLSEVLYLRSKIIPKQIKFDYTVNFKMNRLIERESKKHAKLNLKIKNEIKSRRELLINKSFIASNSAELAILSTFLKTNTILSLQPYINLPITTSPLIEQVTLNSILSNLKKIPDDLDIKPLINQTHILSTKEYTEWNWALISILVRGILWNDSKFEETLKTTKYFKRLLSFYKPQKAGFVQVLFHSTSSVPGFTDLRTPLDSDFFLSRENNKGKKLTEKQREKMSETYVDVGIALIELLLSKPDGVKILRESGIVQSISLSLLRVVRSYNYEFLNDTDSFVTLNEDSTGESGKNFVFSASSDHYDVTSIFGLNDSSKNSDNHNNNSILNNSDPHLGSATNGSGVINNSSTNANNNDDNKNNNIGSSHARAFGNGVSAMNSIYESSIRGNTDSHASNNNFGAVNENLDMIVDNSDMKRMKREGLFGPTRMSSTLSWGYIRFLGTMSSHPVGIMLMEEFAVIDGLFKIVNNCWRDHSGEIDMISLIIREIEFTVSGQLRMLLEKIACVGDETAKIKVTEKIIGELLSIKKRCNKDYTIEKWCVGLLVRQSYDFNLQVSELAVRGLVKYVDDERSVKILLSFNPDLGDIDNLIMKDISSSNRVISGSLLLGKVLEFEVGVEYVNRHSNGLIEQIVERWADTRSQWVSHLEIRMYKKMRGIINKDEKNKDYKYYGLGYFELFEKLVATEGGVNYVINSGIIQHFVKILLIYSKFVELGLEKELYGLGERTRRFGANQKPGLNSSRRLLKKRGSKSKGLNGIVFGWNNDTCGNFYGHQDASSSDGSGQGNEGEGGSGDGAKRRSAGSETAVDRIIRAAMGASGGPAGGAVPGSETGHQNGEEARERLYEEEDGEEQEPGLEDDDDDDDDDDAGDGGDGRLRGGSGSEPGQDPHWQDQWLEDEASSAGLIEETKYSIWALGYIGQTNTGIFAIESVVMELAEEERAADAGGDDGQLQGSGYPFGGVGDSQSGASSTSDRDIVGILMNIHKNSINWELRGSCMVAISRFSVCEMGLEIIEEGGIDTCQVDRVGARAGDSSVCLSRTGVIGYEEERRVRGVVEEWKKNNSQAGRAEDVAGRGRAGGEGGEGGTAEANKGGAEVACGASRAGEGRMQIDELLRGILHLEGGDRNDGMGGKGEAAGELGLDGGKDVDPFSSSCSSSGVGGGGNAEEAGGGDADRGGGEEGIGAGSDSRWQLRNGLMEVYRGVGMMVVNQSRGLSRLSRAARMLFSNMELRTLSGAGVDKTAGGAGKAGSTSCTTTAICHTNGSDIRRVLALQTILGAFGEGLIITKCGVLSHCIKLVLNKDQK